MNLRFKSIKANDEKDEDKLKAHAFDVLTEEYKQVRLSCKVNICQDSV